jgi:hypothetical protein
MGNAMEEKLGLGADMRLQLARTRALMAALWREIGSLTARFLGFWEGEKREGVMGYL